MNYDTLVELAAKMDALADEIYAATVQIEADAKTPAGFVPGRNTLTTYAEALEGLYSAARFSYDKLSEVVQS